MTKLLIKFWPVFLPLVIMVVWFLFFKKRAPEDKLPQWESRLWFITLVSALLIALLMLVVMALSQHKQVHENRVPARYENGKIIRDAPIESEMPKPVIKE